MDRAWYLLQYADVADARVDPAEHYLGTGWREGRDPNPLFDTDWYLAQNPGIDTDPLSHYATHGWREGRDPNPLFDTDWYLAQNPGIDTDPLTHYATHGWREGRDPSPFFQLDWYLGHYPDVTQADIEPLAHFLQSGMGQGRLTCWFQEALPDLAPWPSSPVPGAPAGPPGDDLVWLTARPEAPEGGGTGATSPAVPVMLDRRGRARLSGSPYEDSPEAFVAGPIPAVRGAVADPIAWQDPTSLAVDVQRAFTGPSPEQVELPGGAAGTILWIDNQTPHPREDSGSVRASALIGMAQELGYAVAFVPSFESMTSSHVRSLAALGVLVARTVPQALDVLGRNGRRPTVVWISRPESAREHMASVRSALPDVHVLYDTVDFHALRLERENAIRPSFAVARDLAELVPAEAAAIDAADTVLALTRDDAIAIRRRHPAARVSVIGNVHVAQAPPSFEETSGVVFVGSFRHRPNIDAVEWLVEEIWPLVPDDIRADGLTIVGSFPPAHIRALANDTITVLANASDSDAIVRSSRLSIAPLRFGAGLKGKVGQALALGIPVVGTPTACEGLDHLAAPAVIEAESAVDLARGIASIYRDGPFWRQKSTAAAIGFGSRQTTAEALQHALSGSRGA